MNDINFLLCTGMKALQDIFMINCVKKSGYFMISFH